MISFLLMLLVGLEPPAPVIERGSDTARGRLCGRDATDNEALLARIRLRTSVSALQDDAEFIQLMDAEENVVWTFTVRGRSAFPAVSCSELGPYQGRLAFRQSVVCNGISQTECEAFFVLNRIRNDRLLAAMQGNGE